MILDDDRRVTLEAEIARLEQQLATATNDKRAKIESLLESLRERLDRLELATEIERQSDA